jgi:pyruvate,water dikinase
MGMDVAANPVAQVEGTDLVIDFTAESSKDRRLVGGKAASLTRLVGRGLAVPPGFTVSTAAYEALLDQGDLRTRIGEQAGRLEYGDAARLEDQTAEIRRLIETEAMPAAVEQAITASYRRLGGGYVAVRSSAIAEDMQDASFAGLHDTYLDIRGEGEVLDAVRRCWASLWTARCASYRSRAGIDHRDAIIAVVIQTMVESEVSGVLFTANPLNASTTEFVVNASWGLGEGVVSGILTPDEYIVDRSTLRVNERTLGSKQVQVVRHGSGVGTEVQQTPAERRAAWSMSDADVRALAELGVQVMAMNGGLPMDIEWALSAGNLYLLQARPVTGVDFLWEEDIDAWQTAPDDAETIWSHTWAEAYWTGGVTPLFYSVRARELRDSDTRLFTLWGFEDLTKMRRFKYRRATVYFSSTADRLYYRYILPPSLRVSSLQNLPPGWRDEAGTAQFDLIKAARMHMRVKMLDKNQGPYAFIKAVYDLLAHGTKEADGPNAEELRQLSDKELRAAAAKAIKLAEEFLTILRPGFHVYSAAGLGALNQMLRDWYTGDNAFALQDIISGLPKRTAMVEESIDVWECAQAIRRSAVLMQLLETHHDGAFFEACRDSEDGRSFLELYRSTLLGRHGHRGHADRDLWFSRRSEDPSLDYRALKTLVSAGDTPSPEEMERRLIEKRKAATRDVLESIREQPFGGVKAEVFKWVLQYVHRFLVLRDDERHYIDRVTMAKKRAFQEVGRRLVERGQLLCDDDFYFLAEDELWELIDGAPATPLTRAKIENRRRVFNGYNKRRESPPPYLRGNTPVDLDGSSSVDDSSGVLKGTGTSRGTVTGRARVVPDLKEIGRIEKGDILICNATDPGWASVFALISGLVMETGGLLAHGSCLSREYGLPAVTLPSAIQRIPDGATVTVVGDTGEVRIEAHPQPLLDSSDDGRDTEASVEQLVPVAERGNHGGGMHE